MPHTGASLRGAICALTAAMAVTGCGSHGSSATAPSSSSAAASAPSPKATTQGHGLSVATAPKLASDGITVLTSGTRVTGSAIYPIPGGMKAGKTLAIAINCQGPGRLRVQVPPTGISFPLLCEKGKVLPTMNEIHISKGRATASLQFAAEQEVKWSFAVGWDPDPPEQH